MRCAAIGQVTLIIQMARLNIYHYAVLLFICISYLEYYNWTTFYGYI
jgi:hypothetical protein